MHDALLSIHLFVVCGCLGWVCKHVLNNPHVMLIDEVFPKPLSSRNLFRSRHHPTTTGLFDDEGIIHALRQVRMDFTRGLLSQLSITIWASEGGKKPPSAFELGALFATAIAWEGAVKKAWDDCSLGEVYSDEFAKQSTAFHRMVRNIRLAGQGYYTAKARDALVKPKEAVDRARLQTIAALTLNKLLEPREVRSTRGTRLPGKGRKPKEKCQIPACRPKRVSFFGSLQMQLTDQSTVV